MNLNVSGIYQIRNKINGKIYVGQARNIRKRINSHKCKSSACPYIRRAILKYGWNNFEISILEQVDDKSKLTEREQYWLDTLEPYRKENGYNICIVAESVKNVIFSEEHKAKISASRKGQKLLEETKNKLKNANLGKKLSEETKLKIKMSSRKVKVNQIDIITGEIIYTWNSVTEAAESLSVDRVNIYRCCRGKTKTSFGYIWQRVKS